MGMKWLAQRGAEAASFVIRIKGGGATTFPGRVAIKIDKNIIEEMACDKKIITVTGTNGKTTTSHMITEMMENCGYHVINNVSGANLAPGIATTLICGRKDCRREKGDTRPEVYVIEADEAAFSKTGAKLKPMVSVVTNLFRDQLDRYGELTHTRDLIAKGLYADAAVVINSDDSLVASLGEGRENRTYFFGMNLESMKENNLRNPEASGALAASSDANYCPKCHVKYEFDGKSFSHLGNFRCPSCGFSRPAPRFTVKYDLKNNPSKDDFPFTMCDEKSGEQDITLKIPGFHNLYNTCAAISAVAVFLEKEGKSSSEAFRMACDAADKVKAAFGRMEKIKIDDKELCILLVKNPAGLDRSLSFVADAPDAGAMMLLLNSNFADGKDVSWIWDVDFESKSEKLPKDIFVSGERYGDMLLRVIYSGREASEIKYGDFDRAMDLLDEALSKVPSGGCLYVLPNYTAMLDLRELLVKKYNLKDFWK